MAAGLATVATQVGGNAQLLASGDCGLLIPAGDEKALAAALARLLADPDETCRLGRAARRRVDTHYSRQAMVERFHEFFESLVDERRREA
jgi:glycosyltransferase involved in cell wall biosynthesis